jgi:hypothetical protein
VHIYVEQVSQGCVYLKFVTPEGASVAQNTLNGRFFSGRQIIAEYLTEAAYVLKCPDSAGANTVLKVD